jgi:hypothetical protein
LNFASDISVDSGIMSRQIDYILAKTVNAFNLFQSEIDKESNSLDRVNSKVKILQLYSKSNSEDLYYLGDSFENLENVDTSAKYSLPIASATEGYLTLPVITGSVWPIQSATIVQKGVNNTVLSNGTAGNFHMAIKKNADSNVVTADNYKYIFEEQVVNNLSLIYDDSNPSTYFEYEKLNATNYLGQDFDYEYQYLNSINNQNSFVYWNNADDSPLKLTLVIERVDPSLISANSITIVPFLGYDNVGVSTVKISSMLLEYVENGNSTTEEIITNPIVIGSTIVPVGVDNSANYYYKKAIIKFAQRNLRKATITFIQENAQDISIKHAYWNVERVVGKFDFNNSRDNIEFNLARGSLSPDGIWRRNARFNPALIVSRNNLTNVRGIDQVKGALMPRATNPETINSTSNVRTVSLNADTNLSYDYYVMKVRDIKNNKDVYIDFLRSLNSEEFEYEKTLKPANKTLFVDWWPASTEIVGYEILNGTGENVPKKFYTGTDGDPNDPKWEALMLPYATDPGYIAPAEAPPVPDAIADWWKLKFKLTGVEKLTTFLGQNVPAYYLGEAYNLLSSQVSSTKVSKTASAKAHYNITVSKKYEILTNGEIKNGTKLNIKRWSIGLRDITVNSEIYQTGAEIISKPYNFPYPVEYLMLYSDYSIPANYSLTSDENDVEPILYYISINDGADWLPISAAENPFNSQIPEIYAFNQNISSELRLPGVAYLNSDKPVNSFRVRVVLRKPYNNNGTPLINYYQLAAKVKRV